MTMNTWNDEISFSDSLDDNASCIALTPDPTAPDPTTVPVASVTDDDDKYTSKDWNDTLVSEQAAVLVQSEREVLRAHGIGESEQLFADGKAFLQVGHDTIDEDARRLAALPPFATAVEDLRAVIALECRRDLVGDLRKMRLDANGDLCLQDGSVVLTLEENAWRQIQAKLGTANLNAGLSARTLPLPMRIRTRNKV